MILFCSRLCKHTPRTYPVLRQRHANQISVDAPDLQSFFPPPHERCICALPFPVLLRACEPKPSMSRNPAEILPEFSRMMRSSTRGGRGEEHSPYRWGIFCGGETTWAMDQKPSRSEASFRAMLTNASTNSLKALTDIDLLGHFFLSREQKPWRQSESGS